ncbi:alpha/beta hydrolase [Ramlibacter rhizophilus]|nr:PHB depolymerase family esterase [Ramlibacter rhizophilus]
MQHHEIHRIGSDDELRPALLHVPPTPEGDSGPRPIAVMLHGSGAGPEQGLNLLEPWASQSGVLVLAPASASSTWDTVLGEQGADTERIEGALDWVRARFRLDPERVVIGGFSDGASCALGLGLARADLFSRIVALSPGFVPRTVPTGAPPVFISHGTHDTVLPITRCSRIIAPRLRAAGCEVSLREFDGGHVVPADVARQATAWLLRPLERSARRARGQSGHADSRETAL